MNSIQNNLMYAAMVFLVVAIASLVIAAYVGRQRGSDFPLRWRRRARFIRWQANSSLAAIALLVTLILLIHNASQAKEDPAAIASLAGLALLAVVLAAAYRYYVRLAVFYDARADAADLVMQSEDSSLSFESKKSLLTFVTLCEVLSPEKLDFKEPNIALEKTKEMLES